MLDSTLSQVLNIVFTIILARILSPSDFGLISMVIVFIGFANIIKDIGLGSAIIQRREINKETLSSIFWLNVVLGLLLTFGLMSLSNAIASFYETEILSSINFLIACSIFLGSLGSVQFALIQKELDFKKLFKINFFSTLIAGIVAIVLALKGYGVWSLVWRYLLIITIAGILAWSLSKWIPNKIFRSVNIKRLMPYSLPLVGSNLLGFIVRNVDDVLIGKFLGPVNLGYYNQSYKIMLFPLARVTNIFADVMFPSYALIQNDTHKLRENYLKLGRLISFITFPLMFAISAFAEGFVFILLGSEWLPMVPVLRYLAIVGAIQSIGSLNGIVFKVKGQTWLQFKLNLGPKILTILAIVIGVQYGIVYVAKYYMLSVLLSNLIMFYFVGRILKAGQLETNLNYLRNLLLSALLAIILYFFNEHYLSPVYSMVSGFIISTSIYFLLYTLLSWLLNKSTFIEFKKGVENFRTGGARSVNSGDD